MLAVAATLSGCGLREVRFDVTEPSRVRLPGIQSLAILDFADPYHGQIYGVGFAADLTETLKTQTGYSIIAPDESQALFRELRLTPSRLTDRQVVAEVGRRLGADALLFGDVQEAEVVSYVQADTETRKVGERTVISEEVLPDGNTRTVSRRYPVYQDFWIKHIRRVGRFQAEALLVRSRDKEVLWQDAVERTGETTAEDRELGRPTGDWSTDEVFLERLLRQASLQLIRDLLPRILTRVRNLAEPASHDAYADRVRQGNQFAVQGKWDEAGAAWLEADVLQPARPEARANLGVLRERAGEYAQAVRDYADAARQLGAPWNQYLAEVEDLQARRQSQPNPSGSER